MLGLGHRSQRVEAKVSTAMSAKLNGEATSPEAIVSEEDTRVNVEDVLLPSIHPSGCWAIPTGEDYIPALLRRDKCQTHTLVELQELIMLI
jgi:hypothetical protein